MRAMTYARFGDPDVLRLEEVATPEPGPGEVRVEVHAASVNYPDWAFVRGSPSLVRFAGAGVRRPTHPILGADVAGTVDAVGEGVERIRPGDDVYGDLSACGFGAFADAVTAPEGALARKPVNLGFTEAAAVPMAGAVALQALRDAARVRAGQRVLIVGASGGNGTFAVQLATWFGADVTAVCSSGNVELVRSLGADRVIDYTEEDFVATGSRWDVILAMAGYRPILDYRRALAARGTYVSTGGSLAQTFQAMLLGPVLSALDGRRMGSMLAKPSRDDLAFLTERIEAGDVAPVVDRCYPLAELPDALRYYGEGHARGKVVVDLSRPGEARGRAP